MKADRKIPIGIGLPISLVDRIDSIRGNKDRSEFVREAIEFYLKERQK